MSDAAAISPLPDYTTAGIGAETQPESAPPHLVEEDGFVEAITGGRTHAEALSRSEDSDSAENKASASIYESSNLAKTLVDSLKFLLNDKDLRRKVAALSNEVAEVFKEPLSSLGLPGTIAYRALWGVSFAAAFSRSGLKYLMAKPGKALIEASRILGQDSIAAIAVPTAVANICNWVQNKVYRSIKMPEFLVEAVRSVVSMAACFKAIDLADPLGKQFGDFVAKNVTKYLEKP